MRSGEIQKWFGESSVCIEPRKSLTFDEHGIIDRGYARYLATNDRFCPG